MTLNATSKASLLSTLNNAKNQPATSTSIMGTSTFLQVLDNTACDLVSQTDFEGLGPSTLSPLETAVLVLDGASVTSSTQIDEPTKENPIAPVADAVWLANWFQNNAAGIASSPVPLLGSALNQADPAWMEAASKPLATFSSELVSHTGVSNSDKSTQSLLVLQDKFANTRITAPASTSSNARAILALPTSSAAQATSQSSALSASQLSSSGLAILGSMSPKYLPSDSGNLRPTEVLFMETVDKAGSVQSGQSAGLKDIKDLDNGRGSAVIPGLALGLLTPQVAPNLPHQMLVIDASPRGQSPDGQSASNLAITVDHRVEQGAFSSESAQFSAPATDASKFQLPVFVLDRVEPALMEATSKPLATFSSEFSSRIGVPDSDKSKPSPLILSDKPANTLATAPVSTPSNVAAVLLQPTSSAIQATSQSASIGVIILDKKSPKNLSIDSDHLRASEVFSRSPMDPGGSVKLGKSVGYKDFNDVENDRLLPVMPGSEQVSLDSFIGENVLHQTVGTEAATPGPGSDPQWTSDLADTVNQWVERSLQLAELRVPDAGQDSLQVRIELNGQEATVYFLTDHVQYRDAIESQIGNLSDRLAEHGLKLAGSFVGQGSSQNSPQQPSAHSMLSRRPENEPASAKGLSIDPVLREMKTVSHGRVLDVFA